MMANALFVAVVVVVPGGLLTARVRWHRRWMRMTREERDAPAGPTGEEGSTRRVEDFGHFCQSQRRKIAVAERVAGRHHRRSNNAGPSLAI
jgi:hypothetical protein